MNNMMEYLPDILLANEDLRKTIYYLRTGQHCYGEGKECDGCEELSRKWLLSEYVKPPINWYKVKNGTMIRVQGYDKPVRFVGTWNGEVFFTTEDGYWSSDHNNYSNLHPSKVESCESSLCYLEE